jgi:hypothetical protein
MSAPICLFVYNRVDDVKHVVESLQQATGSQSVDLFVFSDGAKKKSDIDSVESVRMYLKSVSGFRSMQVIESDCNKGLANSIISGISKVLENHDACIVLEDDLRVSIDFIQYMNLSLDMYKDNVEIFSISGFGLDVGVSNDFGNYFWERAHSWGWATWKDRWETVIWDKEYIENLLPKLSVLQIHNIMGSDFRGMCQSFIKGRINSWYVRFAFNQYVQGKLTSYPFISKVKNEGFSEQATHCKNYNRYRTRYIGNSPTCFLSNDIQVQPTIRQKCLSYFSISSRAYGKVMTLLLRFGIVK